MVYFSKNLTKDQAKKLFRKLAVELHPDKGGSHAEFVKMQSQYESFLRGNFNYTSKEAKEEATSLNEFVQANEFVKSFKDVLVELTGTWVWLSGNTSPYKEEIKKHGFRWSKSKKKWYKAPYELKRKKRVGTNFDKIKSIYGYQAKKMEGVTALNY